VSLGREKEKKKNRGSGPPSVGNDPSFAPVYLRDPPFAEACAGGFAPGPHRSILAKCGRAPDLEQPPLVPPMNFGRPAGRFFSCFAEPLRAPPRANAAEKKFAEGNGQRTRGGPRPRRPRKRNPVPAMQSCGVRCGMGVPEGSGQPAPFSPPRQTRRPPGRFRRPRPPPLLRPFFFVRPVVPSWTDVRRMGK